MPSETDADSTEERIRLNLVVNRQVKNRIEHLQELSEATSITEVVRRSLALYEEILKIREQGSRLVVESNGEREVLRFL